MSSRIETLLEYLAKKPGDRFALYSLALEQKKLGDVAAAQRTFEDLLRQHPTAGAGHFQYGLLLTELGRRDDARQAYTAGLAALRDVAEPEARRSFGEISRALDDLDDD